MPGDYFDEQKSGEIGSDQTPVYKLSRSQKIMASLLAFFALFVIILWSVQFKNTLNQPFAANSGDANSLSSNGNLTDEQSLAELTSKDTDADGLSDYEELYVKKTSPYLEDSDSDGFNDKQEIANNTDPNCPAGQTCFTSSENTGSADNSDSVDTNSGASSLDALAEASASQNLSSEDEAAIKDAVNQSMDADTLRQLLLEKGMDKAMLDKISDEELMKSFEEILNQQ